MEKTELTQYKVAVLSGGWSDERDISMSSGRAIEEPRCHGRLNFALPGRDLRCYVFVADEFTGTIKETDKNLPLWVNTKKLPFGKIGRAHV